MDTRDELAGVVELFGGLTREELEGALVELAYKQGTDVKREALDAEIEAALSDYYLVETEHGGEALLVAGPVAFPSVPENGADLPHIMDVETRSVDRESVGTAVHERLREEASAATEADDEERVQYLLDVSYDVEAWAPVAADDVRERLDG